jgi:hypothetical protein
MTPKQIAILTKLADGPASALKLRELIKPFNSRDYNQQMVVGSMLLRLSKLGYCYSTVVDKRTGLRLWTITELGLNSLLNEVSLVLLPTRL